MAYDMLDGVTVVEVSMYAFAPAAAAVLADWGADVIKVVPPAVADPMRGTPIAGLPPARADVAFMWEIVNRGKRCIGLDLADGEGQAILHDLIRDADVFITNLLPDARRRFTLDIADIQRVKPDVIYARASAHGPSGPEAGSGGFDHTDFWARTGMAHAAAMVSDEFVPQPGPAMGDLAAGAFLAGGVAAALVRRARTGRGAVVDVSLLSAGAWMFSPAIVAAGVHGVEAIPRARHLDLPNPLVAGYRTADNRIVYFAGVQTDKNFANFCEVAGCTELLDDPRFATGADRLTNARSCIEALDAVFASRTLGEWLSRLPDLRVPWAVVQTPAEAAADPQVLANHYLAPAAGLADEFPLVASPAQFDQTPPSLRRAPEHGGHTEEILLELGYDWDRVLDLKARGAVT